MPAPWVSRSTRQTTAARRITLDGALHQTRTSVMTRLENLKFWTSAAEYTAARTAESQSRLPMQVDGGVRSWRIRLPPWLTVAHASCFDK